VFENESRDVDVSGLCEGWRGCDCDIRQQLQVPCNLLALQILSVRMSHNHARRTFKARIPVGQRFKHAHNCEHIKAKCLPTDLSDSFYPIPHPQTQVLMRSSFAPSLLFLYHFHLRHYGSNDLIGTDLRA